MIEYHVEFVQDSDSYIIYRRLNLFFFTKRLRPYMAEFREESRGYQNMYCGGDGLFIPAIFIPITLKGKLEYFGQWRVSLYRGEAYSPSIIEPSKTLASLLSEFEKPYREVRNEPRR